MRIRMCHRGDIAITVWRMLWAFRHLQLIRAGGPQARQKAWPPPPPKPTLLASSQTMPRSPVKLQGPCSPAEKCCRKNFLKFDATSPTLYWHERVALVYPHGLMKRCCAREYDVFHVGMGQSVVSVDSLLCNLEALVHRHLLGARAPIFKPSGLAFPGLDAVTPGVLRREVERCLSPVVLKELGMDLFRILRRQRRLSCAC